MDNPTQSSVDNHALLIEIKTKLERVIQDVAKLNDNLATDITKLQVEKQDKEEALRDHSEYDKVLADHETRIRANEQWRWKAVGIIVTVNAIIGIGVALLSAYISKG